MFCKLLACKNLKTQELFKLSNLKLKLQCTPTAMLASLTHPCSGAFGIDSFATNSTMGIRHDVEQGLEKYKITKIDGHPKDEDLNLLMKELTNAAGSVATQNGGREHGHVGMVVDEVEYVTFSKNGTKFLVPMNPGPYPTTVDPDKVIRE